MNRLIKVNASHSFYQDVDTRPFLQNRQLQGKFTTTTVQTSQQFTIGKNLCPIMYFCDLHRSAIFDRLLQSSPIQNRSPPLIKSLHRLYIHTLFSLGQIGKERSNLSKLHFRYLNHRKSFGNLRQLFSCRQIIFQQITKLEIFVRSPSRLTDRRIVIVRTTHSGVRRIVGTTPMPESSTSMGHIETE